MSTLSQVLRALRPAMLVVLGALIGAGVAPTVAAVGHPIQASAAQTRSFSCTGLAWVPQTTDQEFFNNGLVRSARQSGYAICNAVLPTHAVVNKVQFTLLDSSTAHELQYCSLIRLNLAASGAASYVNMAEVPATGVAAAPGYVRQSDSSINSPTIDNSRYMYYLQCKFVIDTQAGAYGNLGILGADVVYRITAANG